MQVMTTKEDRTKILKLLTGTIRLLTYNSLDAAMRAQIDAHFEALAQLPALKLNCDITSNIGIGKTTIVITVDHR